MNERMAWLYKWASQDDGPAKTPWQKGYEAARGVVKIHFDEPPQQQEPVAWMRKEDDRLAKHDGGTFNTDNWTPLYTAPPQRPLLTEEELDQTTAQARDDLLDHIYEYGTNAEGVLERVRKLCRAIERKVRGEE